MTPERPAAHVLHRRANPSGAPSISSLPTGVAGTTRLSCGTVARMLNGAGLRSHASTPLDGLCGSYARRTFTYDLAQLTLTGSAGRRGLAQAGMSCL